MEGVQLELQPSRRDKAEALGLEGGVGVLGWGGARWGEVVWCGLGWYWVWEWCGVVWCGVMWCNVVWCGVVFWPTPHYLPAGLGRRSTGRCWPAASETIRRILQSGTAEAVSCESPHPQSALRRQRHGAG